MLPHQTQGRSLLCQSDPGYSILLPSDPRHSILPPSDPGHSIPPPSTSEHSMPPQSDPRQSHALPIIPKVGPCLLPQTHPGQHPIRPRAVYVSFLRPRAGLYHLLRLRVGQRLPHQTQGSPCRPPTPRPSTLGQGCASSLILMAEAELCDPSYCQARARPPSSDFL